MIWKQCERKEEENNEVMMNENKQEKTCFPPFMSAVISLMYLCPDVTQAESSRAALFSSNTNQELSISLDLPELSAPQITLQHLADARKL